MNAAVAESVISPGVDVGTVVGVGVVFAVSSPSVQAIVPIRSKMIRKDIMRIAGFFIAAPFGYTNWIFKCRMVKMITCQPRLFGKP